MKPLRHPNSYPNLTQEGFRTQGAGKTAKKETGCRVWGMGCGEIHSCLQSLGQTWGGSRASFFHPEPPEPTRKASH